MWGGTSPVGSDLEWQSQRKSHFKNEFSLCRRSFTSPKIYLVRRPSVLFLGFLYWSGIILFSSDLFLSFHFFLFFLFISSFPFLSLGIRVLAFAIRSPLRRFCRRFSPGERRRILFMGQGSKQLKAVSQHGLFIVCARFWYSGQDKFTCLGIGLGLNFHIISTRHA